MIITIRNIDKNTWHKLKMTALRSRISVGIALTKAINKWVDEQDIAKKINYGINIKPLKFKEKQPEDVSANVDKYLYGE